MNLDAVIAESKKPLVFIAHQDDELSYAGLIQRLGKKAKYIFLTNGDGIAPAVNADPEKYAELRKTEAINALGVLGVPKKSIQCLDYSEIEIYSKMADIADQPGERAEALEFFEKIQETVAKTISKLSPDLVFTTGFQGGHPEHDLAHFFCALALREIAAKSGRPIPFYHLPEYELTILVPFRFGLWYKGERLHLTLTDEEFQKKMDMVYQYPSQEELFRKFRKVFGAISVIGKVGGKEWNMRNFWGTEEISPVPPDIDYTKAPYPVDFLNYMFDDFQNRPITFAKSIRPITRHFLEKA